MSGMFDKAKDALGKATGGSSSSGSTGTTGGSSSGGNSSVHKGIDMATDKVGMGDKYDSQINKFADSQMNKQGESK